MVVLPQPGDLLVLAPFRLATRLLIAFPGRRVQRCGPVRAAVQYGLAGCRQRGGAPAQHGRAQNERKTLYAQADKILWDDAVGIFTVDLKNNYAIREDVQRFEIPVTGRPDFSQVSVG
ncbi:hypothetical protein [Micromonospora sp. NPDC005305]|uniref:hypothetical protein n=1 Tax=Micromonospora sp. NPDC005305 TaxID=3156875 RepID=UPI00339DBB0B